MQLFVAFLVIGLLEQDVGADAGVLQHSVFLHRSSGDVDVDPADGAVFMVDGVYGFDTLQYVFDRVVDRIFAGLQGQPLVSHILESDDFSSDVFLGQLLSGDVLVLVMIWTVDTAVDAVVGQVQRREHDDAVAVEILFDLLGHLVDLFGDLGIFTCQQHRRFPVADALAQGGFVQDLSHQLLVVLVLIGVPQ